MFHSSPEPRDLAQRLVLGEAGDAAGPAATAVAVETVCCTLGNDLKRILGSGGISSLLTRALHLAQRDEPLLEGVRVTAGPEGCFTGLADALEACTDEEARVTGSSVVAHLLALLVTLLGEDLGLRPVRKLWPQVASSAMEIDE